MDRRREPAALVRLAKLAELRDSTERALDAEVGWLVRAGVNYGDIAAVLGVSRQAVRQRHLRKQAADRSL